MKSLFATGLLMILTCGLALAQEQSCALTQQTEEWKLAFVRNNNIWVSKGDGTDQRMIIKNGRSPYWSPGKNQIAFARSNNVWIAKADGTGQRPLTFRWGKKTPDLSAFGRPIDISWNSKFNTVTFSHWEEFRLERVAGYKGISRVLGWPQRNVIGNSILDVALDSVSQTLSVVRFDFYEDGTGYLFSSHSNPAWSKSGDKLAFVRNGDIWIAYVLEKEEDAVDDPRIWWDVHRLAAVASFDEPTWRASRENYGATHLSWSPDGRYLAYYYRRLQGSGVEEIRLIDMGSNENKLLVEFGREPAFSPDGQFIAYSTPEGCEKDKASCLWVVSIDGKIRKKLLDDADEPIW